MSSYHAIGHDVVPVELSAIVLLLVELFTLRNEVLQLQIADRKDHALCHYYIIGRRKFMIHCSHLYD